MESGFIIPRREFRRKWRSMNTEISTKQFCEKEINSPQSIIEKVIGNICNST
jgi:hypothetical protein